MAAAVILLREMTSRSSRNALSVYTDIGSDARVLTARGCEAVKRLVVDVGQTDATLDDYAVFAEIIR